MSESWVYVLSSITCAALLLGSGCLGTGPFEPSQDQAPQREEVGSWVQDGAPGGGWTKGKAWRYAVSGAWVDEPGFVTVGVVEENDQGYLLGSDSPKESARSVAGAGGLLSGHVEHGSLSLQVDGRAVDLLGLERAPGESWEAVLWGTTFTMVKGQEAEVAGAAGYEVAGVAVDGSALRLEYGEAAKWLVSFRLEHGDGRLLLGYRLLESIGSYQGALESWRASDRMRLQATPERIGRLEWVSPGDADRVVIHVQVSPRGALQRSEPGSSRVGGLLDQAKDLLGGLSAASVQSAGSGAASVTVLAPGGQRVVELRELGPGTALSAPSDAPGTWRAVASTAGPTVQLIVVPVDIERYVL